MNNSRTGHDQYVTLEITRITDADDYDFYANLEKAEHTIPLPYFFAPFSGSSPIFRLPPELLINIFSLLSDIDQASNRNLGWIRTAAHTCRTWRTTALGYRLLWATFRTPLLSERWSAIMLARAGPRTPLRFFVSDVNPYDLFFARNQFAVVRELCLVSTSRMPKVYALLTAQAPALEALDISLRHTHTNFNLAMGKPGAFLGGHAPVLRRLRVRDESAWFPWASPLLRGLTSLEVTCEHFPDDLPSIGGALRALAEMHELKKLVLTLAFSPPSTEEMVGLGYVSLPCLTYVDLTGPMDRAAFFLYRFEVPARATLKISLWPTRRTIRMEDIGAFFTALSSSRQNDTNFSGFSISSGHRMPSESPNCYAAAKKTTPVVVAAWHSSDGQAYPRITLSFPSGSIA
ncbi:hypothetical protein FA95DRAFT_1613439 [Auriscalpium vulgare]|uniref:Uncharacterized protein n=1 Tax=Auriscalpium vulgare TaxID=40419 RepID=A0ACB8R2R3_9AGAM|nr:hypothetical protein FA95DRAFT_1613439 [Auriscalpium vulgare]